MQGICWESFGTPGRSRGVIWCFDMRHFALWWMMVVSAGLASSGDSSRVSGQTLTVTGKTRSCFEPMGV